MNKKIFGTDGIRSRANGEFMNPIFFNKFAIAIDKVIFSTKEILKKKRVIIGKDTRRSGYMIESALSSAFMALGIHVILTGPIPTAVIPFLMKEKSADLGFNISASHNPFNDNGIKIFDSNGKKLSDEIEMKIEQILFDENEFRYENLKYSFIDSRKIGYLSRIHNAPEIYSQNLAKIFKNPEIEKIWKTDLSKIKIVLDLANGSAYKIAPMICEIFGIKNENLILLNNKPDGFNINLNCGAVFPENLGNEVLKHNADLGLALDGDADRIVFVNEKGIQIDNDKILAYSAKILNEMGILKKSTLVVNISSNSGIEKYLSDFGISVKRVPVGDKHLTESFEKDCLNFGGEKSGHIIFPDFMIGGDGLLSGILILSLLKKDFDKNFSDRELKISEIFESIKLFHQISKNFDFSQEENFDLKILENEKFLEQVLKFEKNIKTNSDGYGRILIRKSGTEKKIRLIAEGKDENLIESFLEKIIVFLETQVFS
jgi:phosphoglucosamine mutase